ncbi:branched chain amino acid ABC transporter substrate-binding protein [Burkholderia sp. WAC0059]|uniref:branched-chain amino acid ABC transporter substrate-binding protein n=1 Tax=Burkholderia sp. WAC0059 TaxID=2066022 RepID=UPI000C7EA8B2|nr:branched-chain amino acid ABC transporter substrate-binding protein [Burkholderia sp. WAC0059]PLZ04376.1 branched chain amino acid ABC transporter substrate-binding protein [Burkholderia sp. WAC0059]
MSPFRVRAPLLALCGALALGASLARAQAAGPLQVSIGFAAPLSGENAVYGKDLEDGVQLALDEANAESVRIDGRPAHFALIAVDDRADPRAGVQAAQQLVNRNVPVVIGHFNSGTTIPALRVYESAGIPMIDPAATNPAITNQGFANAFMVIANDAQNASHAADYALDVTKAKRIAILDDRSAFGQGEADVFAQAVRRHGGTIVVRLYPGGDAADYRPLLAHIRAAHADLLFFGGFDTQAATVAREMQQAHVDAQLVMGGGVANAAFIRLAGRAAEGAMAWEYGRPLAQLPDGQAFERKFRARFGVDVLSYAPFAYDATWAAIRAMEAAKSAQPDALRGALRRVSFDGVTGHIAFAGNGALRSSTSTLYQVRQGAWVPIVTKHDGA